MADLASSAIDPNQVLWARFSAGDAEARDTLLAQHYQVFRQLARSVLAGEGPKLQIQPTELAHEAAIRLMRLDRLQLRDRAHFLALSSRIMRQIILDEVRRFRARKRQMPPVDAFYSDDVGQPLSSPFDLEAFDEALERLAVIDPEKAKIVERRFYAGLTMAEIAAVTGASESTVKRQWRIARAWLLEQLTDPDPDGRGDPPAPG
jgi:RNA polymerase sigma factor (TIGR02999 family)